MKRVEESPNEGAKNNGEKRRNTAQYFRSAQTHTNSFRFKNQKISRKRSEKKNRIHSFCECNYSVWILFAHFNMTSSHKYYSHFSALHFCFVLLPNRLSIVSSVHGWLFSGEEKFESRKKTEHSAAESKKAKLAFAHLFVNNKLPKNFRCSDAIRRCFLAENEQTRKQCRDDIANLQRVRARIKQILKCLRVCVCVRVLCIQYETCKFIGIAISTRLYFTVSDRIALWSCHYTHGRQIPQTRHIRATHK